MEESHRAVGLVVAEPQQALQGPEIACHRKAEEVMTPVQLPEVPSDDLKNVIRDEMDSHCPQGKWITGPNTLAMCLKVEMAAQLRAYATECVLLDRRVIAARVADLSAWLRSGNEIPADLPFVFRERWQKIVADIRAIEILITQPEQNSGR